MKSLRNAAFAGIAVIAMSAALSSQALAEGHGGYSWSGLYVGGQVGYGFGDTSHSFSNLAPGGDSSPDGFLGGVHIGYMMPMDQVVLGVEADIEATGMDGTYQNPTAGTSSGSTDINWQGSVRAKVGYDMGQYLPYVTAGVAFADVDYGGGPLGGPCCGYSSTAVGWTAGAGMNVAITDAIFGGFEYRYTDFGTESGGLAPTFPAVIMPVDLQTHTFRVSLSVKLESLFGQ
ncbi:MAG: outer membrane protein [Rhizobiaceae bacterium]